MGRLRWVALVMLAAVFLYPLSSNAAGRTVIYGPYASNSPDSGTCGNDWANDTMDRVYKVDTVPNAYGTYNVTEEFKNGTFTTIAGSSPGACQSGSDNGNTVPDGLTGKMQGSFSIVVTGGTYDPTATCAAPCYTKDFIASVFGVGPDGYNVTTYNLHYNAASNGQWKNASSDRGGNSGDITG